MAVEIPVIIDIDGAFQDAARRVSSAITPLQSALDKSPIQTSIRIENIDDTTDDLKELNRYFKELEDAEWERIGSKFDFSPYINQSIMELKALEKELNEIQEIRLSEGGSGDFSFAEEYKALRQQATNVANSIRAMQIAQEQFNQASTGGKFREYVESLGATNEELLQMREYYRELEGSTARMSDSINAIRGRINDLNAEWNNMTKAERESARGLEVRSQHKEEIRLLKEEALTLDELLQKEQRKADLIERGIKTRQYENAILNSTIKTARVLQEQERILSDRLSRAQIGSGKYEQLRQQLEAVRSEIKKINGEPFDNMAKGADRAGRSLSSLLINAVKLYALHSAGRFVANVREVTAEFELQKVALGSIIQDTKRAEELFHEIKAAAIESPFEIKDLVSYTKQLSAYQIETDKLFDTTKKLADISAGLGVDMSRLVLAYGQVRAASVLRGQELRQFTEAGIPLVDKLAEKFRELGREGTTTADVFQLISERAVPFRMIEEIFDDMTSAGGMFYKMQEKQAKTLAGQWANLKDAASIMYDEIGNTEVVRNAMEYVISSAKKIMQNWRSVAGVIKAASAALIVYVGYEKAAALAASTMLKIQTAATAAESAREKGMKRLITSIIGKTAAEKVSTQATNLHWAAMLRATLATNTLSKAFWKLTAAMLNNPFGLVAVAVAGLVALFSSLSRKSRDVAEEVDAANASINALNKSRSETQKLIDSYEELRNKAELSTDEQRKLRDISKELAELFPRASKGVDEYTGALDLNVEALKRYNAEATKASEKALKAQIRIDKKELGRNEREIGRLESKINLGIGKFNPLVGVAGLFFQTDKQIVEMNKKINKLTEDNERYTQSIKDMEDALAGVSREAEGSSDDLQVWQEKLTEFNKKQLEYNNQQYNIQVLSPDQIKNYSKLDAALEDIAKQYKEQEEQVKILEGAIESKNGKEREELALALALATARRDLSKEILEYYNALWLTTKNKKGGDSYQKDPFITKMENWIKFMKDFKKGYDDLRKYMSDQGALDKQFEIMEKRGLSMGISPEEQRRAANDLSKWYEDTLAKAFSEAKKHGATGSMASFMSQQISDKTNKGKTLRAFQELMQSLWDAKTDFDTAQAKENIENAIKKLTDDIKKTETAREFFKNILDLTGDQELAANMAINVYGGIGKDFKDRIQEQLYRALTEIEPENIDKDLMSEILGDITVLDVDNIQKNLEKLPRKVKELFEQILAENQKYNAEWLVDFEKTYAKAASYQERVNRLVTQRQQKENEARAMGKSPEEVARVTAYYEKEIAKVQLEAMKDTYTWTKTFEDLDGVSSQTLENLIALIDEYIRKYGKELEPEQLRELTRAKENARAQKLNRNAYMGAISAIKAYNNAGREKRALEKAFIKSGEQYNEVLDDQQRALKDLAEALQSVVNDLNQAFSITKDILGVFSSDADASYFGEQFDNISKILGGTTKAATGIMGIIINPADVNSWKNAIQGVADVFVGIFAADKARKLREINSQIEHQQDLLDSLEYDYGRLEKAIAKAFGSDYIYNYNKQLENLYAQQAAYQRQADLEREKGKKADEEKIKDYENSARDAADQIAEMGSQLSEFFTGTDLSSAAQDFANSWIEAYKEFGSTTDAMKEKFQDMVQSMIEQSLGAKIMQSILQPLFDSIDEMAQSGGELTAQEIAQIGQMAPEYIDQINNAMTGLMNSLAASGYNVRQQMGSLTGISRDIAGASEESINGLAAGINTQNFYMSLISQNVAAILQTMTGGEVQGATGVAVPDTYKETMMGYAMHIPTISEDIAAIKSMLSDVIKQPGAPVTKYVYTYMR